jgi:phage terminase small subunit
MPRQSAASLAFPSVSLPPLAIEPPNSLSGPAKVVFRELVDGCDPDHFQPSDIPLLAQYSVAIALASWAEGRLCSTDDDERKAALAAWEKAIKAMTSLALRLRLSPQARREKAKVPGRPMDWMEQMRRGEMYDDEEDRQ